MKEVRLVIDELVYVLVYEFLLMIFAFVCYCNRGCLLCYGMVCYFKYYSYNN